MLKTTRSIKRSGLCAVVLLAAACAGDDGGPPGKERVPCSVNADCADVGARAVCLSDVCWDVTAPPDVRQRDPQQADLDIARVVDTDPSPEVFEASLRAEQHDITLVDGTTTSVWVYIDANGDRVPRIPGPAIDVERGTRVRITLTNALDMPTSIAWHGVLAPATMDGGSVGGPVVAPGESFTYVFDAREQTTAWLHPLTDADVQVERGLYAPFIVRDTDVEPVVDVERVLMIDDILLDDNGQVPPRRTSDVDGSTLRFEALYGRHGNHVLINGVEHPVLAMTPGTVERWRVINAANGRFFDLHSDGVSFVQIGSDGGMTPVSRTLDRLVLAPGERIDVLIQVAGSGDVSLMASPHGRGIGLTVPAEAPVATLRYASAAQDPATAVPATSRVVQPLGFLERPDKVITLDQPTMKGDAIKYSIGGFTYPAVMPLVTAYGQIETWEVKNTSAMDLPFHMAGNRFQVLSVARDGEDPVPELFLSWKDTVVVPAHSSLRFVVRFSLDQGPRLFGSSVLEHVVKGLMGIIDIRTMMG